MMVGRKLNGRAVSVPEGLAYGVVTSTVVTIVAAVILGKLVDSGKILWEKTGYGIMVLLLVASFAGASMAYRKIKRQRLVVCLLAGFAYYGVLLSITALFFGGQYEAVGVTALLVLAGSGSAALLGMKEKRGGGYKKYNSKHRKIA